MWICHLHIICIFRARAKFEIGNISSWPVTLHTRHGRSQVEQNAMEYADPAANPYVCTVPRVFQCDRGITVRQMVNVRDSELAMAPNGT